MWAAHTFVNIAQVNWPRERHYETGDFPATTLSHFRAVASAWSGNDQLWLESAAPAGVKWIHVNNLDVEGTVFQTF